MKEPLITVLTATRTGEHVLDCINAIAMQTYPHIEHLVLIDENDDLLKCEAKWKEINPKLQVHFIRNTPRNMFVNSRIGMLYNYGFDLAQGEYLARVDDDNTVTPEHLSSLYKTLRIGDYDACYSWRYLHLRNGQPYVEPALPWHAFNDPVRAKLLYQVWNDAGITTFGSNLYKDKLFSKWKNLTFPTVDASEWLWKRSVLQKVRFKVELSYFELLYGYSDDDMFSVEFIETGLRAGCSEQATLNYFLGGHSNYLPSGYGGTKMEDISINEKESTNR